MKKTFTLLSALASAFTVHAQPTLTLATNAPVVGTQYTVNYGNYVNPGNAGALQSWNLSGLTSDSTDALQMVAPSSTTNGNLFPGATVAEVSNSVTTYYQVNGSGIHFTGSDDGTSIIVNQPAPKYLAFPCTMGSNWSSPHAAVFDFDGEDVFRSGIVSCEADGYGTLTMPWGTVNNVLRIHMLNEMQDSLALFTMDYTYDSYLYYVAGQSYPIAELVSATIDFGFGTPQLVQFSRWTGAITTGIDAPVSDAAALNAYPNPTSDVVNIVVTDDMAANASVAVLDAMGRVAHQERLVVFSGSTAQVDMGHLAPGIYTLVIMGGNGRPSTARITLR